MSKTEEKINKIMDLAQEICQENDCNVALSTTTDVLEHKLIEIEAKITRYDDDLKLQTQEFKRNV